MSFASRGGAYRAIYNLNEMEIRGSKIIVKEYSRSGVFWNLENRETFCTQRGPDIKQGHASFGDRKTFRVVLDPKRAQSSK